MRAAFDNAFGDTLPDQGKLSGVMKVFARRVKSIAHEAGHFVVEIGFLQCERQNRRHVLAPFVGGSDFSKILCAVADAFDTDIVSEHQAQFWGFETEEEWDKWQMQRYRKGQAEFLAELMRYLSDQPNNITSGTIRMMKAEIAKKLVDDDPSLLLPANQDKLLENSSAPA